MADDAERKDCRLWRGLGFCICICWTVLALLFLSLTSTVNAEDKIRFGASLSLTGRMATEGRLVKDGYDFYVKHINALGGIPINGKKYKVEIIYYDDESDPKTAVRLVEKLIVEESPVAWLVQPPRTEE